MAIEAFVSCRFPPDGDVNLICQQLAPEVNPFVSQDVKLGSLPQTLKEQIAERDCLIAIVTESGIGEFMQNEIGMAYALEKPIFAICKHTQTVPGIQPYISTYERYDPGNPTALAKSIANIKLAALSSIRSPASSAIKQTALLSPRSGGASSAKQPTLSSPAAEESCQAVVDQELIVDMKRIGVESIYPDRATAFRTFLKTWEKEKDIRIVASSMEGFKRGIGVDAQDLILPKLESNRNATVRILLTHPKFAQYREQQEEEQDKHILRQISLAVGVLYRIRDSIRKRDMGEERIQWRLFKGAPTCFMIIAGESMLLNPYLYMQSAHFNFGMIVKDTKSIFDIFNHYKTYHFERAWAHPTLSRETTPKDAELPPQQLERRSQGDRRQRKSNTTPQEAERRKGEARRRNGGADPAAK